MGKMQPERPTAWASYISVADADETAEKVKAAGGGVVVVVPMDVMDIGRMASSPIPPAPYSVCGSRRRSPEPTSPTSPAAVLERGDEARRGGQQGLLRRRVRLDGRPTPVRGRARELHGVAGGRGKTSAG